MSTEDSVSERFVNDVAAHEMTVKNDTGLYRHLTFRKPDTFACGFHITTWPGYLCISGDMGCFVFTRLTDMFEFFRIGGINPQYWAEKLTATDREGHRRFSRELYRQAVESDFAGWEFDSEEDRKAAWSEIEDEWTGILGADTVEDAMRQATDWVCPVSQQRFQDFWEHTLEDYSFRFLWCCFAIQWAIKRYDVAKAQAEALVPAS